MGLKMKINLRRINKALHRDLGYFFAGMAIIYGLSGIALNHKDEWNSNYIIELKEQKISIPANFNESDDSAIQNILNQCGIAHEYKSHYSPKPNEIKIFLAHGSSVVVDTRSGIARIETIRKRPLFFEVNFLHYNPGKLWTWFSDIFAISLIILAITGLFIQRGKYGIQGRGAWLSIIGMLIPIAILITYL